MIGGVGIARKDPDFMASFVLNHILGGSAFSSRLYKEVREVRGLAYSVYSAVFPLDYAALFMSGTATRADRTTQTLEVMQAEIAKLAQAGPTEDELVKAKSFLEGSYALRFDTSTKIAEQLVQIQLDDLGMDYIDKRNGLVEAVTLADVQTRRQTPARWQHAGHGRRPAAAAGDFRQRRLRPRLFERRPDFYGQAADARDLALEPVARHGRGDA